MSSTTTGKTSPVRTKPMPGLPVRFDGLERKYLDEALKRNTLFYNQQDGFVSRMLARVNQTLGSKYAVAVSSGTAGLHAAVGALGVKPGGEVITSPITDAGSWIGILYQNAVPVFADVDPRSYNVTAESIEAVMTERTQAVMVIHLTGAPADMDPIIKLCKDRRVPIIEDCAQSYGCWYQGKHVGVMGEIGCFSLNDFKHLSAGDGGFVITNDEQLYHRCHNYADKFYDRHNKGVRLTALAPNYRMSELQGAVGLAQFDKFKAITEKRNRLGDWLNQAIDDIPGVLSQKIPQGGKSSYWFYMFRVDPKVLGFSRDEFVTRLQAEGIPAGGGYVRLPSYREPEFQNKSFFPGGVWPAELAAGRTYDYTKVRCPNAELVLESAIRLPLHEGLEQSDVQDMAAAIRKVATGG